MGENRREQIAEVGRRIERDQNQIFEELEAMGDADEIANVRKMRTMMSRIARDVAVLGGILEEQNGRG